MVNGGGRDNLRDHDNLWDSESFKDARQLGGFNRNQWEKARLDPGCTFPQRYHCGHRFFSFVGSFWSSWSPWPPWCTCEYPGCLHTPPWALVFWAECWDEGRERAPRSHGEMRKGWQRPALLTPPPLLVLQGPQGFQGPPGEPGEPGASVSVP